MADPDLCRNPLCGVEGPHLAHEAADIEYQPYRPSVHRDEQPDELPDDLSYEEQYSERDGVSDRRVIDHLAHGQPDADVDNVVSELAGHEPAVDHEMAERILLRARTRVDYDEAEQLVRILLDSGRYNRRTTVEVLVTDVLAARHIIKHGVPLSDVIGEEG